MVTAVNSLLTEGREEGRGMDSEFGVGRYKLLFLEWIKILVHREL